MVHAAETAAVVVLVLEFLSGIPVLIVTLVTRPPLWRPFTSIGIFILGLVLFLLTKDLGREHLEPRPDPTNTAGPSLGVNALMLTTCLAILAIAIVQLVDASGSWFLLTAAAIGILLGAAMLIAGRRRRAKAQRSYDANP